MKLNHFVGATLLVAGTSIGAGMLALPVSTAQYGFYPSALVFVGCWFFMMLAALYMLEVNLWLPDETNLISMADATLGKMGATVAWITYLLLLYALLSAYTSGLGALLGDVATVTLNFDLPNWVGALLAALIGAVFIYLGTEAVDSINRLFVFGLLGTLAVLLFALLPHSQPTLIARWQPQQIQLALPIIFTTFGFQIIIPTLRTYLQGNPMKLRNAIIIGSVIPLMVYLLWEAAILGAIPLQGEQGLAAIYASGQPEVGLSHSLTNLFNAPWLGAGFRYFAAFAIATSFLGVSLSLFDFLGDGFHTNRHTHKGRFITLLLTFAPPLFFAVIYPNGFIMALKYAGICVAILLVFLPAMMVWSGRYVQQRAQGYRVFGGKLILLLVMLFAAGTLGLQAIAYR